MDSAKIQWRDQLQTSFDKAQGVFLTSFSGVTVEEVTILRKELRKADAEFRVVKNTIAKKAIEGREEECISDLFKGQVGAVFANGDVAAAAKIIKDTAKKNERLAIIGGYMEGKVDAKGVEAIASLPSKEVLLGQIVGSIVAPHRGLLGVTNGVSRALVQVINAIKDTKEA